MEITKLEAKQRRRAGEVATSAFFDYPMMRHYFPNSKTRKRKLRWYLEQTLRCAVRFGEVWVTPDCCGVLFVLPPGHTRLTDKEFIQNGFLFVPFVMGLGNYKRSNECEAFVADTQERLLGGRAHYYLWGLVTDPQAQRKGVGSALLKKLTARADAEKLPIYLETHAQSNVAYYERFGFQLIHTDTIPKHGLALWCMLREAGHERAVD